MEDRMITAGAGIEPLETRLTEQLDHRKLQAESTQTRRDLLLHIPDRKPDQLGPYFFFQVLNYRNPDGNSFSYMIISTANDHVSRTVHEYKWFPTGFDSFVGEFKRAYPAEKEVEFKYRFCASGHSKLNWNEYHVRSPLPNLPHVTQPVLQLKVVGSTPPFPSTSSTTSPGSTDCNMASCSAPRCTTR